MVTTIAIIIGVLAANIIKPGAGVTPPHVDASAHAATQAQGFNWVEFLSHIVPSNIVDSFAKGEIVQILFFGVLFAIGLQKLGNGSASVIGAFEKLNKILFNVLHIVIKASPIGAFGGMAFTVGTLGIGSLKVLGYLLGTYYITSLVFIFIILNLIAKFYGFSLWKLLGYIKEELLIVFGAAAANRCCPTSWKN